MNPFDPLERVLGAVVPRAVDAVDLDEVLRGLDVEEVVGRVDADALIRRVDVDGVVRRIDVDGVVRRIDVDGLMARIDVDALIQRVDVDQVIKRVDVDDVVQRVDVQALLADGDLDELLARIDTDAVLQRIDVNALLARIDPEALLDRIDPDALVQRIDVNALVARVDVDALVSRVDVESVVQRANIDSIVREASMGAFARGIDLVRRQLVGLDLLLIGTVARVMRRPRATPRFASGTVTGKVAGGVSRLAAFAVDTFTISFLYGLLSSLVLSGIDRFFDTDVSGLGGTIGWVVGLVVFAFLYYWIALSLTGRSVGKGLLGLRVIRLDGGPIHPGQAALRTLVYPFSFILGLGLLGIVFGKRRRALHDMVARTQVVYDWGDRPAELPAPVTQFLRRSLHGEPAEEVLPRRVLRGEDTPA